MKILHIGPSPEQKGGVATVIRNYLFENKKDGVEQINLVTTSDYKYMKAILSFYSLFKLFYLCACGRFDIAHVHMSSGNSCFRKVILIYICKLFKKPYILHVHGGKFNSYFESEISSFSRSLILKAIAGSERVIVLTNIWKKWFYEKIGIDSVVLYNGVRQAPLKDIKHKLEGESKKIVFLGRLCNEKGILDLILAFDKILCFFPSAKLFIAGCGDVEYYKSLSKKNSNIIFTGWLAEKEKFKLLNEANVLCLPSWNEALGISLVEAMSLSIPVVATNVGGIPEVVDNGVTGILVDPKDPLSLAKALLEILNDDVLAELMGSAGYTKYINKFEMSTTINALNELYEDVWLSIKH